jgi:hypothetical protein
VTIVPAVAPGTELLSPRPLYGRIASTRWYTQFYWPMVLDQTPAGRDAGYYDRLLVDRNHDGDMTDEGECIEGLADPDAAAVVFVVGDLYIDGVGKDRTFQIRDLVVQAQANGDPAVTFAVEMDHRMFDEVSYSLTGPFGSTMKFSSDLARMPTLNLTPEIAAGPEFKGKEIRLTPIGADAPFKIGQERSLELVCLTGDREENDHVLAIANRAFARPVFATLVYTDREGVTRGREFRLEDWKGKTVFAGQVTVPDDARPGAATLVMNFSERMATRDMYRHFTQLVFGKLGYVDADGMEGQAAGWKHTVELSR